jgi:hypothetical protein
VRRQDEHGQRQEAGGCNEEAHAEMICRADWRSVSGLQGIR